MKLGIPKEIRTGERRVAVTPDTVARLAKLGFEVLVEKAAGERASFDDDAYAKAGATLLEDTAKLWASSDIVLKVQPPEMHTGIGKHEAELLREQGVLVSFLWPAKNQKLIEMLAARKATVIAMDQVPRITRAQKMDALSSMANIAGYRAVIEAASFYGRFFTGQMTAAGKVPPAKVLVIGAGVAGLAAIGTARGLGAVVRAFDTRAEAREQIQSLGAEFLDLGFEEDGAGIGGYARVMSPEFIAAEMAMFARQAKEVDIIITTALVPGRPAPTLITEEMVRSMRPGSVIADLAAEEGGNCALTQPGQVVERQGVTIIGYMDLPSRLAPLSSQLYGTNLFHLLADMGGAMGWHVDLKDAVVRGALVLDQGSLCWPPPKLEPPPSAPTPPPAPRPAGVPAAAPEAQAKSRPLVFALLGALGVLALVGLSAAAPPSFLSHLTVFVLACFVGWQVVWNVTPALHTPLMSVTNAISGIIILGGMLQLGGSMSSPVTWIGAAAVLLASINVVGGFWVTQRMLRMFRR